MSYHLNLLHNSGKVRINRVNDRVTRYFSQDVPVDEFNLIGLFRQLTNRRIIMCILESGTWEFNDIVEHTKKVPSTISCHLSKLSDANIIKILKQNEFRYYEIGINKIKLMDLLSKYKSSFTEKIIDDYVDMINEF